MGKLKGRKTMDDKEIDIDAPRYIPLSSRTLGHKLKRFEFILDDTYQLSELLELCSKVNELVGKPIFYRERERVNGMYLYKRRQTYDLTIKIAIWETFKNTRVSKVKQEQFIDRLYHICNRIYIKLPMRNTNYISCLCVWCQTRSSRFVKFFYPIKKRQMNLDILRLIYFRRFLVIQTICLEFKLI